MTLRPIIFDADSVRAILAGNKTQFRVPVKPQPEEGWSVIPRADREGWFVLRTSAVTHFPVRPRNIGCPLGGPGAGLYVKEPWESWANTGRANGEAVDMMRLWRSPIFMPRACARVLLEIVAVRVERVQEIKCYEIRSEGIRCPEHDSPSGFCCSECDALRAAFSARWNRLYAKRGYPWASNPWVFAIEFRPITPTAADAAGEPRHA